MASIDPQNAKIIQPPSNPFFWPQVIEWSAIIGTILILAGGGFFFVYPMFQKFQTLPKVLENEKNAYGKEVRKNFEERGKPYGISIKSVEERNDLAETYPGQKVFIVEISGEQNSLSGFKQILEIELPLVRLISETAVSEGDIKITVALPVEPSDKIGENTAFNEDLYSFSKFRIIKESNVDY